MFYQQLVLEKNKIILKQKTTNDEHKIILNFHNFYDYFYIFTGNKNKKRRAAFG